MYTLANTLVLQIYVTGYTACSWERQAGSLDGWPAATFFFNRIMHCLFSEQGGWSFSACSYKPTLKNLLSKQFKVVEVEYPRLAICAGNSQKLQDYLGGCLARGSVANLVEAKVKSCLRGLYRDVNILLWHSLIWASFQHYLACPLHTCLGSCSAMEHPRDMEDGIFIYLSGRWEHTTWQDGWAGGKMTMVDSDSNAWFWEQAHEISKRCFLSSNPRLGLYHFCCP